MLSTDVSTNNNKTCQLQHKTLPPHINFLQLKNDNILKPIHYSVKHEDVLHTQKNDSLIILVDYGDDQFTLRIQDNEKILLNIPLLILSLFNQFHDFLKTF